MMWLLVSAVSKVSIESMVSGLGVEESELARISVN